MLAMMGSTFMTQAKPNARGEARRAEGVQHATDVPSRRRLHYARWAAVSSLSRPSDTKKQNCREGDQHGDADKGPALNRAFDSVMVRAGTEFRPHADSLSLPHHHPLSKPDAARRPFPPWPIVGPCAG